MEEILASIRKIIAEDVPGGRLATPAASSSTPPVDVIELTEVVEEAKPTPPAAKTTAPPAAKPAAPTATPSQPGSAAAADRLVSGASMERSAHAMEALRAVVRREGERQSVPLGEGSDRTVEEVVRELVKPMLREWLDANLPPLVERLVEKEIRDISRRSGGA